MTAIARCLAPPSMSFLADYTLGLVIVLSHLVMVSFEERRLRLNG